MNIFKQNIRRLTLWLTFVCMTVFAQSCHEIHNELNNSHLQVKEGIPGMLTLQLASAVSEERDIQTRNSEGEFSEQHLHSVYIFIIEATDPAKPETCQIIARKYFPDILPYVKELNTPAGGKVDVAQLQIPAVSTNNARIYAIANIGYSDLQGISNDAYLLDQCDKLTSLSELMKLSVELKTSSLGEVNVERMQGHHLMSGFYGSMENMHYLQTPETVTLMAQADGSLSIKNKQGETYRPIGSTEKGKPGAIFVHRLDTKITVRIEPAGDLKNVPGAYFRLLSWQVINAPTKAELYFIHHPGIIFNPSVKNSKVFQRDISQGEDNSWEFTFYQLQNCVCTHGNPQKITSTSIAEQYNKEYGLSGASALKKEEIENSFVNYPNDYSNFAYTLRELQEKKLADGSVYDPNAGTNDDQTIIVQNGNYAFAPKNSSMVRLIGRYFNPNEPARRMKDDPRNQNFPQQSISEFPYWGENEKPVRTKEEALKRSRSATVTYYVHLGYVGGGNYNLSTKPIPSGNLTYEQFAEKVNDYNVLRNHHYTYTLKVAGVENIKLEATREDHGNILAQEKQPGAEGTILESQHLYNLDSHYETRNVTIDFTRLPQDYTQGFSFTIDTPFDKFRATLKKSDNSDGFVFVDKDGKHIESIRNHDMDWIHFAWHGTPNNPYQSLIDPTTGNGISYSNTYGGYENQQTYNEDYLTHTQDQTHRFRLLNSLEFSELVWRLFVQWVKDGKSEINKKVTFTMFVDENYYDYNPVTNEQVNWCDFCNKPKRKAMFFMEPEETSADQNSWYANAHVAVYQNSIQTLYATDTKHGQVIANVAFGIEALDEFRAKYSTAAGGYDVHNFKSGQSLNNGLYNTMMWFKNSQPSDVIDWQTAENYFSENVRAVEPGEREYAGGGVGRESRRGQWAVYSRNRDLDRNGKLDDYEIRWFVPAIDQYTLCFLGGRPVFENPLFEKDKAVKRYSGVDNWIYGVPVLHYMSSTNVENNRIFWSEEGCSKGNYNDGGVKALYGIRMARMLCDNGVDDHGGAFAKNMSESNLKQDALFSISHTPNGVPIDYNDRVDGKSYYIVINKMNTSAFRDMVSMGDLAQHTHEQKENWLYRSYRIGKNKIGYTSYTNENDFDRNVKIDGVPRTWWQVNGIWSPSLDGVQDMAQYYYRDKQHSLAYVYHEDPDGRDLHKWRMPNLREAAIMSIAFPQQWFNGSNGSNATCPIAAGTRSENLGQTSSKIPFWQINCNLIGRMSHNSPAIRLYVRPIQDSHLESDNR